MSFSHHFSIYIFVCIFSLSFISSVSCAGPSRTLVDPNNSPHLYEFERCDMINEKCINYYCATGTCYQQNCMNSNSPDITIVPYCVPNTYKTEKIRFIAAIQTLGWPMKEIIQSVGSQANVLNQMVILNIESSDMNFEEIVSRQPNDVWIFPKEQYDIMVVDVGFFGSTDAEVETARQRFIDQLYSDSTFLLEGNFANTWSIDNNKANIFVNITNIQRLPATFAIQHCSDGTAVLSTEICPVADPALVPMNTASTSKFTTTQLLTIILPASIAVVALIIAAAVIVRRRRANKVMRETVQHTEAVVEVTVA